MPNARRRSLRLLLAGAFALSPLALAPATFASCAPSEPLERVIASSEVVIVGTVTALANDNRWAQVSVEQIWKGGPLPAVIEVRGGPEPGTASSVDRQFVPARYLFTLYRDGTSLTDNACSGTTEWNDGLLGLRPADWAAPEGSPDPGSSGIDLSDVSGFLLPAFGVGLLAALVVGGSWLISRRAE